MRSGVRDALNVRGSAFTLLAGINSELLGFGVATAVDAPRIGSNLPTPWVGLWERADIYVFLVWVAVLAVLLLRDDPLPRNVETGR